MKTATFPFLRVTPVLRQAAEQIQREFIVRGLRSRDDARQTGKYACADAVIGRLEQMLATAKGGK